MYCELLLESPEPADESPEQAIARIREVRNRAETALRWYGDDQKIGTLNFALDHLTLGRTYLLESQETRVESQEQEEGSALDSGLSALDSSDSWLSALGHAEEHLNESVALLRQSGRQDQLPSGLLHRAALWRVRLSRSRSPSVTLTDDPTPADKVTPGGRDLLERAERDLDEADLIAERGSMLIWQIEAALERCRLCLTLSSVNSVPPWSNPGQADGGTTEARRTQREWIDEAQQKLEEAKTLIKQTEKPYEPHVPDWDNWEPPEYVGVFKKGEIIGYHRRNDEIETLEESIGRLRT